MAEVEALDRFGTQVVELDKDMAEVVVYSMEVDRSSYSGERRLEHKELEGQEVQDIQADQVDHCNQEDQVVPSDHYILVVQDNQVGQVSQVIQHSMIECMMEHT